MSNSERAKLSLEVMESWNWLLTVNCSRSLRSPPPRPPRHVARSGRDRISGASEREAAHNVGPGLEPRR